jgi:hypothetical protein
MPAPLIPPPIMATSKSAIVLVLAAGLHASQRQMTVQADVVEQDTCLRIVILLYGFCLRMIISENRIPLFGIML